MRPSRCSWCIGAQEYELWEIMPFNYVLQLAGCGSTKEYPTPGAFDGGMLSLEYARNFYDTDQRPAAEAYSSGTRRFRPAVPARRSGTCWSRLLTQRDALASFRKATCASIPMATISRHSSSGEHCRPDCFRPCPRGT